MDDTKELKKAMLAMWGVLSHIENMLARDSGYEADTEVARLNAIAFGHTVDKFAKEEKQNEQ